MNHKQFIDELKKYNFHIEVVGHNDSDYTFYLCLNGIRVNVEDYGFFGYRCGGVYATCAPIGKNNYSGENIIVAIQKSSDILMKEIETINKVPNYFDCRDFLNNFGKSKIEKQSIKRVLGILKDNYQELLKSVGSL